MAKNSYDRTTQDVGNILGLEHVNVTVPDQTTATVFYVSGLGFTRDPYMMVGPGNMWVNLGQQQFHLPTSEPQVFRGCVGVVVPDLSALKARLTAVERRLQGTAYRWVPRKEYVDVTCPWGNQIRCHAPAARFGEMTLGIPYVEIPVGRGSANGIAQFYREVMLAPAIVARDKRGAVAEVNVGPSQTVRFRETANRIPAYDGHHIAVYLSNFSGPYKFLKRHKLITQETDAHQYRFQAIIHPKTDKTLCEIEHEVRSVHHPMYERALVNRNPDQRIMSYTRGRDAFAA